MKNLQFASLLIMLFSACFVSTAFANSSPSETPGNENNTEQAPLGAIFTAEMRWTIKREVMSKPGVMLDMANMTDNGYVWTNDVVWVGSDAGAQEGADASGTRKVSTVHDQWYVAGFMFQRPRYKDVWLQYAFTLSGTTGEITNFRRWYGNAAFR